MSIPKKKLEQAEKMYMENDEITIVEIAKQLDIKRESLQYHVNTKWKPRKNAMKSELLRNMSAGKASLLAAIHGSSLVIIKRAIEDLAKRDKPPSISEAKGAKEILDSIDKITRLDQGSATDITEKVQPKTKEELRQALSKADPFNAHADQGEKDEEHTEEKPIIVDVFSSTDDSSSSEQ